MSARLEDSGPTAPPHDMPSRRDLEANIRTFYIYRFLSNLQLWLPIWVLYLQQERHLTLGQVTALDAPFWLVVVVAEVPTGAFADRYGRRTSLVVGSVVLAAAYTVFGLADSYPLLLASYGLWAIGMTFGNGADMALLYDNLAALGHEDDYARVAGRAYGLLSVAAVVALLVGATLADATRLDVPVLASAAITLVCAGVALRLKEPPHRRDARPGIWRTARAGAAEAWREPHLRYMLAFSAALTAVAMVPILLVQPYLAHYGAPVGSFGLLQAPARLGAIAAALYAYRLSNRIGERRFILALPLWIGACFLVLAAWDNAFAFVVFPMLALGLSAANPVLSDYLNRHTLAARRATVLSIGQLFGSLLMIGLEPALGAIGQAAGLQAAFLASLGFVAAITAATVVPWALLGASRQREPAGAPTG